MLPIDYRWDVPRQNPPIRCHDCGAEHSTRDYAGRERRALCDAEADGWIGWSRLLDQTLGQCPACQLHDAD